MAGRPSSSAPSPTAAAHRAGAGPRVALVSTLLLALALGACGSNESELVGSPGFSSAGRLDLRPGGRAEGRATVPAGATARIRLVNNGPGTASFVLRKQGGAEIAHGPLTVFTSELETTKEPTTYVLVIEAHADGEVRFAGHIAVEDGDAEITWDVTR
jgi:hypothetical protein